MSPRRPLMRLEERISAYDAHVAALSRHDAKPLVAALVAAVALHLALAVLPMPSRFARGVPPSRPARPEYPAVSRLAPALPAAEPVSRRGAPAPAALRPAPPVVLSEPEPVPEPPQEAVQDALPREAETLIGEPEPPPAGGPPVAALPVTTYPRIATGGRAEPAYPAAARSLRVSGTVDLDVEVREDGRAGEVRVVECSRPGIGFEKAAEAAVRGWRFIPATRDGVPVSATMRVQVTFTWSGVR